MEGLRRYKLLAWERGKGCVVTGGKELAACARKEVWKEGRRCTHCHANQHMDQDAPLPRSISRHTLAANYIMLIITIYLRRLGIPPDTPEFPSKQYRRPARRREEEEEEEEEVAEEELLSYAGGV